MASVYILALPISGAAKQVNIVESCILRRKYENWYTWTKLYTEQNETQGHLRFDLW